MSTQGASTSSPSSSSTPRWTYDVFLSFRGEDTRKSFTDHLYNALKNKGIFTFRDDTELERGKFISQELVKAIEESRFAIVIFSINYAFSTWCLDELEHIVRCRKEKGLEVFPVFYHVDPSDVRKQKGTFAEAFDKYKESCKVSIENVETWKSTLTEVANLSGWDLQYRHESEFVKDIVEGMWKKLSPKFARINENLIGIESFVKELITSYLDFGNNVCMIGICGMGGIGKTTLARVVCERYSDKFEVSSFIADVREKSKKGDLLQLQKKFLKESLGVTEIGDVHEGVAIIKYRLRHKKVLLVLDDVDHVNQLENLVGKRQWFGSGSWIIITTRDKHVLVEHGVLKIYELNGLKNNDALKLFCLKAFKNEQPKEDYMRLSQEVVNYARGLPLALVTLGSFLIGRKIDEWQSALDHYKKNPKKEIFDVLKISYDGLEEQWKEIFLDIACLFKGWSKFKVIRILENCDFNARIGISVLLDKSLLTVTGDNEELGMHDLLQEMGEKIVQQSCEEFGRKRRLWLFEDLLHVLDNNMATNAIQAIVIRNMKEYFNENHEFHEENDSTYVSKIKIKMIAMAARLSIWNVKEDGIKVHQLQNKKSFLSPEKLFLIMKREEDINFEEFLQKKNKEAALNFKEFLEKKNYEANVEVFLGKMNKEADFNFEEFPEVFSKMSNLRLLIIDQWHIPNALDHVPNSLRHLSWNHCSLNCLPSSFQPKELVELDLWDSKLKYLWEGAKCLGKLKSINLYSSVNLLSTPDFSGVPGLEVLNLAYCTNLVGLHPSIGQLSKLKSLNLYCCTSLTNLPSLSAKMESLILVQTAIKKLPSSLIECLTALEILDLHNCSGLECLPSNMDSLRSLKFLNLSGCSKLANLPKNLWKIKCLERLILNRMHGLNEIELNGIGSLSSLEYLSLRSNNFVTLPATFSQLSKLEALDLSYNCELRSVPELPSTTRYIGMEGCDSLEPSPELLRLSNLLQPCYDLGYDESSGGVAFTILNRYLQGLFCQKSGYETATKRKEDGSKTEFQITIPGNFVPRWLMHQSWGNSISVVLSPNWCNRWWMGFILCAHFQRDSSIYSNFRVRVKAIGDIPHSQYVSERFFRRCSSDVHIWLLHLSRDDWFSTFGNGECSQIEVVYERSTGIRSSSVLHCGVSLVYMQDMEVWYSSKTWNGSKCTMQQ